MTGKSEIIAARAYEVLLGGHPVHFMVHDAQFMAHHVRRLFPGQLVCIRNNFWTIHPKRWDKNHLGPKVTVS